MAETSNLNIAAAQAAMPLHSSLPISA